MTIYTEPCVTGEAAAYLMLALILTSFALVLFGFAMKLTLSVVSAYKSIARDKRLMAACGDDPVTAELVIANTEFAGGLIDAEMKRGLKLNQENGA